MTETKRKWLTLAATVTSLSMVFVDQTALPITLPSIQREFATNSTMLQWIVNAYLLVIATFVIVGGKIGDLYGHKRIFLIGQVLFVLSSISCAIAPSILWIIMSRAVQGLGGALMIPATTAIIYNTFSPHERGKAMGIYIGIASVFLTLGPLFGGILSQYFSWRWVFGINFPIALFGSSLGIRVIPKDSCSLGWKKIDGLGFLLIATAIFSLVFSLMEGPRFGWLSPFMITCYLLSGISVILFFFYEKSHTNPLVDLGVFRDKMFSVSCISLLLFQLVMMCTIFWVLYLQYVSGLSAARAGLYFIFAQIPVTFMAPLAGRLVDRWGPRKTSQCAIAIISLCCIWIAYAGAKQWLYPLLIGFIIYGGAIPMAMSGIMSTAMINISPQKRGVASGVLNSARQLGASIGLALLSSLMSILNNQAIQQLTKNNPQITTLLKQHSLESVLAGGYSAHILQSEENARNFSYFVTLAKNAYAINFFWMMLSLLFFIFFVAIFINQLPKKKFSSLPQEVPHAKLNAD